MNKEVTDSSTGDHTDTGTATETDDVWTFTSDTGGWLIDKVEDFDGAYGTFSMLVEETPYLFATTASPPNQTEPAPPPLVIRNPAGLFGRLSGW